MAARKSPRFTRACWLLAAVFMPSVAAANIGSPLIWYSSCYLLLGNWFIGLFEAWVLRRLTPDSQRGARAILIGANYFTMAVGVAGLSWFSVRQESLFPNPLRSSLWLILGAWILAYLATIVLEWPFVAWASGTKWLSRRSLTFSLKLQSASYAILMPLGLLASGIPTLYTQFRIVDQPAQIGAEPGWVYFLDKERPVVCRIRTDGTQREDVRPIASPEFRASHAARELHLEIFEDSRPDAAHLKASSHRITSSTGEIVRHDIGRLDRCAASRGHGVAPVVGSEPGSNTSGVWVFDSGWPDLGLDIDVDGTKLGLGAASPFVTLTWRNPIVLPSGVIVAQAERMIVLIEPRKRMITELAPGVSPVVALDP